MFALTGLPPEQPSLFSLLCTKESALTTTGRGGTIMAGPARRNAILLQLCGPDLAHGQARTG